MKKFLAILVIISLVFVACANTEMGSSEYGLKLLNVKGGVTRIEQKCLNAMESAGEDFSYYEMGMYTSATFTADYDDQGNPIHIREFTPGIDEPLVHWYSEYDEQNILTKLVATFIDGQGFIRTAESKDGKAFINNNLSLITVVTKDLDGRISTSYLSIKYDDQHRIINYLDGDYQADDTPYYQYNEKGFISFVNNKQDNGNDDIDQIAFTYNSKNYMESYLHQSKKYTFKYEYDQHDNWVKQMVYLNDKHILTNTRIYTYGVEE